MSCRMTSSDLEWLSKIFSDEAKLLVLHDIATWLRRRSQQSLREWPKVMVLLIVDLTVTERQFSRNVKNSGFPGIIAVTRLSADQSPLAARWRHVFTISCKWGFSSTTSTRETGFIECVLSSHLWNRKICMAEGMLPRSLAPRLKNLRRCRQLAALGVERRGLRVVTGGDARSVASVLDHVEETTTVIETKPSFAPSAVHDAAREKIDMSFENAKTAYMSKTNFELLRGYGVFQMCSVRLLVNKNKQVDSSLRHS